MKPSCLWFTMVDFSGSDRNHMTPCAVAGRAATPESLDATQREPNRITVMDVTLEHVALEAGLEAPGPAHHAVIRSFARRRLPLDTLHA
jgi:hypothetical protein